jgi:putative tryptophan/tyrosine transport system substrate-binding protein
MMRRELIVLLGASIACSFATPAAAQQAAKVPLIGILTPSADEASPPIAAFRRGMRDLGYVEGQTVRIVLSKANGDFTALPRLAAELAGIPVDVIVTDTTSATQAAFGATRTIPIVMGASGGDPVALGVAKSMARPGANVTGLLLRSSELNPKRLELLKQAVREISRVAVLFNPTSAIGPPGLQATQDAAKVLGIEISGVAVSTPAEVRALQPDAVANADGMMVLPDGMFWQNRAILVSLAAAARMPAIYPEREYADDGGLIAYGANVPEHFRLAAGYVDRILRGANPAELPIDQTTKLDFIVNLRTAKALGLAVSADFLSGAGEVIE